MKRIIFFAAAMLAVQALWAQRTEVLLDGDWLFHKGETSDSWQTVTVPHDWAITGPFSRENDIQSVTVKENGETRPTVKTGRTGGLPFDGLAWYRTTFTVPEGKCASLVFDGVMSCSKVFVNGREASWWPNGYNAFHFDATPFLVPGTNLLEVRVDNLPRSSRWYPGAGIYRNVHLVITDPVHVPVWGTRVTTPFVSAERAVVRMDLEVEGSESLTVETVIRDASGRQVASAVYDGAIHGTVTQNLSIPEPELWSPEHPSLYVAETSLASEGRVLDRYVTRFGVRTAEFIPYEGFFLNGEKRQFKGVCNHHDLGPLGAAVSESALRHQILMLKDMGCDAIRTSHNMPAPELVDLCDELGMMLMVEAFDEWDVAKCGNGYHLYFDQWAEKDLVNMIRHFRNSPSVILWSIGNEVPTQCSPEGYKVAARLQDICHREDPTRKVTTGMNKVDCSLYNGFAALIDVPGINYHTVKVAEGFEILPQGFILGTETASTVSSRGIYKTPVEKRFSKRDSDHQCSSYDEDACNWSNVPDIDFALADKYPWYLGQFVWTGFDYLGEPTPYDVDSWPNHSSMFGIIDLASIPKDRYYLYRSVWNKSDHTVHILPHWNWDGKEGEDIPVMVYTDSPRAELFLNGKSLGIREKAPLPEHLAATQKDALEPCYRLMWNVPYEPGKLEAVALDLAGNEISRTSVMTAGKAHHIALEPYEKELCPDGKSLSYVTVSVVDKDGNLCPADTRELSFKVKGAGKFRAVANGDPTCLESFVEPHMHAFSGRLTVLVQAGLQPGDLTLEVNARGIRGASVTIPVK